MTAITTIIPTYRRPQLLRRAIQSVLRQTYGDFQVRVYDNASGDETGRVVAELAAADARVIYHCHPHNIGAVDNFLYGMQHVDTPFFSFLSDDDVLFLDFFKTALAGFERYPQAMASIGSTLEFSADGRLLYVPLAYWPREGLYVPPGGVFQMLGNRHPTWTAVLFRREVIERVGLLDRDVGLPADLDYELRIAARFPFVVSFKPCGAYVSQPSSGSVREDTRVIPGYEKIIRNLCDDERIDPQTRKRLRALLVRQIRVKLLEIAIKSLVRGDDSVSRDASVLLGDRYRRRSGAAMLLALRWLCARVPGARRLLIALEAGRLRLRSRASPRRQRSTAGAEPYDFDSYANYLRIS